MRESQSKVIIKVMGDNWGDANRRNIKRLLENVASHLTRYLREEVSALIEVRNWDRSPDDCHPPARTNVVQDYAEHDGEEVGTIQLPVRT